MSKAEFLSKKRALEYTWNQILYNTLTAWLKEQAGFRHIPTLPKLAGQLQYGWAQKKSFVCFFYKDSFLPFIDILRQRGLFYQFYIFNEKWITLLCPAFGARKVVVAWLKPKELLGGGKGPCITFYNQQTLQYTLTYQQVYYLTQVTQEFFIFNTPFGMVGHEILLKKHIGGVLVCGIR